MKKAKLTDAEYLEAFRKSRRGYRWGYILATVFMLVVADNAINYSLALLYGPSVQGEIHSAEKKGANHGRGALFTSDYEYEIFYEWSEHSENIHQGTMTVPDNIYLNEIKDKSLNLRISPLNKNSYLDSSEYFYHESFIALLCIILYLSASYFYIKGIILERRAKREKII